MNERLTVENGVRLLACSSKEFVKVFGHGSLAVEYYRAGSREPPIWPLFCRRKK